MIRFSFTELGIVMPEYNGLTVESVNALIIDKAADYYMAQYGFDSDTDCFIHYNWPVDLVQRFIEIPDNALIIEPVYH